MIAVQEACARIGMVTGRGIASVVKLHYNKSVLYGVVILVLVANVINIGADIGAMASAAQLLMPVPFAILTLLFTIIILLLEIFTDYHTYSRILKWLALALLAYPITLFIVHQPWATVIRATFIHILSLPSVFFLLLLGC